MDQGLGHDRGAGGGVGPSVGKDRDLRRQELSLPGGPQGVIDGEGVALAGGDEGLLTGVDHPGGPAGDDGRQRGVVSGGEGGLVAEAAADGRVDDPEIFRGKTQDNCEFLPVEMGVFAGHPDGRHAVLEDRHPRFGFHVGMLDHRGAIAVADHHFRFVHRPRGIPLQEGAFHQEVSPLVDPGGIGTERLLGGKDAGERFVVHLDQRRGLLRSGLRLGDDEGHGVAHIADLVHAEGRLVRPVPADDVLPGDVGMGQHRDHSGMGQGRGGPDRQDPRMGPVAPQDLGVEHSREGDVPGVTGVSRQLVPAIDPPHRPADHLTATRLFHLGTCPTSAVICQPRRAGRASLLGGPRRPGRWRRQSSCNRCNGRCCPKSPA